MAAPTEAEVQTQIGLAIQFLDETEKFARSATKNVEGMYDGLIANPLEGDYSADTLAGMDVWRATASSMMDPAIARGFLDPLFLTYGKTLSFPERDIQSILVRLYQSFVDNTLSVLYRNFTFGSPSAGGGNVGDGVVNRLNTDRNNLSIENQTPDAKVVECIADEHSGAASEGRELFEIRGANPFRDFVAGVAGIQRQRNIQALNADDSESFITNPSFGQLDGAAIATPDTIPGWTVAGAIGDLELDETDTYRSSTAEGGSLATAVPRSLKFTASEKISQNFNINAAQFDPNVPYYVQIAYNRAAGTGDGTLNLRFGSQSESVALVAQSGWNILRLTVGQKNWFQTWNEEDPDIEIEITGQTTGYNLVDDVVVGPYTLFDGGWYAIVGGATPFLRDDVFTFTDSAVESIIQKWLWRIYGFYLRHVTTSPTWAEPT